MTTYSPSWPTPYEATSPCHHESTGRPRYRCTRRLVLAWGTGWIQIGSPTLSTINGPPGVTKR